MQIKDTKDIIKILPLGEDLRKRLLESFDTLETVTKDEMTDVLWDAYDEFYNLKLDENMQLGLIQGAQGSEPLDDTFYNRMVDKTDQGVADTSTKQLEQVDLSSTRQALEELLKKDNKSSVN